MKLKDVYSKYIETPNTPFDESLEIPNLDEKDILIYETEEDAAGLYIDGPAKNEKSFSHFRLPFVYQISPDGGSFEFEQKQLVESPISYRVGQKCIRELFSYLDRNLEAGGEIELYAGWDDGMGRFDEPRNRSLDLILDISIFELGEQFIWQEKQYILIKKS
ncbi:hypothetical protein P4H66_22010 [Paenibacillus dokdonensis]|uniref:Uncharacterized protein n=1 Tax=Paenibacillus dokdonensis TaxID=2567944 RepID=A0ABU6GRV6_9BACL|nr:hypothetical protein [Paenibacillus dokdonensis]MEC0242490.1 hypothetical protein [Paenibacillus dokdonensis]